MRKTIMVWAFAIITTSILGWLVIKYDDWSYKRKCKKEGKKELEKLMEKIK